VSRFDWLRETFATVFRGKERVDLTDGGIAKPLFFLSLPIVVTNLLQTAYNLADTFWLGQFSTEALASITFAFPMVFLLISLGFGVSVAGSVLVAQNVGNDEERQAEFAASQTVTFAFVVSTVLGAIGLLFVGDVLTVFGAEPVVLEGATEYMRVISAGLPLMFGFFVFTALMRGYGDTVTPMLVQFGTVVLNIVIDPLFIFGVPAIGLPQLGVEGAAYATVISRGLAMVVGLAIMFRGRRGVRIRTRDMVPNLGYFRRMLRIGVPASVEGTGRAVSVNLMLVIVGLYSTTVVAAFGVGVRVFSTIFLPAIAVARGVETMAGQNIGAGKQDRAQATADVAAKGSFVVLAAAGVVVFLAAEPIVALFTDGPQVVAEGANFLRIVAPSFGFIGIVRSYSGAFRGAGQTMIAAAISLSTLAAIRLPTAWFASQPVGLDLGPTGIWAAFLVSNVLGAGLAFGWFRRGRWRDADATRGMGGLTGDEPDGSDADAAMTDD
jgi:putative MATE family efflux protein